MPADSGATVQRLRSVRGDSRASGAGDAATMADDVDTAAATSALRMLRAVGDAAPAMIAYIGADLRYRYANEGYRQRFASPAATRDLEGRHVRDVIGETAFEAILPHLQSGLAGNKVAYETTTSAPADEDARYVHVRYNPDVEADGTVVGIVVTVTDSTARRAAEEGLRQREQTLNLAVSAAQLGSWDWNLATGALAWSDQLIAMFGFDPASPLNYERFLKALHPDDRASTDSAVAAALREHTDYDVEYRIVRPDDGSVRWISAKGCGIYDEHTGQPLRMTGVAMDITARKQIEQALRQSEETLRLAITAADMGTWDRNLVTGEMVWSDRHKALLGWPPETVVTRDHFAAAIHPEDRQHVLAAVEDAIARRADYDAEYRVVLPDGQVRWIVSRGRAVYDELTGQPLRMNGIALDITVRKLAEADLRRAKDAAEAAGQAKDHFLAILSHELRTPLTPVLTVASSLETDPALDPSLLDAIRMIRRNVELEAHLIDDLLDLTRVARGKLNLALQPLDVHACLNAVVEMCASDIAARRHRVTLQLSASRHFVQGDRARVQQIFWNLLKNAIKFTPDGGTIVVTTCDEACAAGAGDAAAGRIRVSVIDNGRGIDPAVISRLFEPFEQGSADVTRHFGGLGLGLAIASALVHHHGGHVSVHSEGIGHGSTFSIRLDAIDAPAAQAVPPAASLADAAAALRILLVDDHEDTAFATARLLKSFGHRVTTAGSVADALNAEANAEFDLLLSDVGLPDGSGHDLVRRVHAHRAIPAIALSGYGMEDDVRQSKDAGFLEHLTKPINIQTLRDTINRVCGEVVRDAGVSAAMHNSRASS